MLSEEFPTSNIRCQHLYRLMAAHLLHFENTCAASLGLGQKTRSQTMSGKLSGIVTSSRRILFYQACYAPVRHRSFRRTVCRGQLAKQWRSEEHTSELQSLMRSSYAVFCLKKKKTNKYRNHIRR